MLSTLENWLSERCTRLLRQGTEEHMLAWLEKMANKTLKTTKLTRFKTKLQAMQKNLERKIERAKKVQEAKSQAKTQSGKKAKKGKGGKKK